jgi:hypothetical protein
MNSSIFFLALILAVTLALAIADPDQDLVKAVHQGDIPALKAALQAGANVNKRGSGGQTALMAATLSGQTEVVTYLLDNTSANPRIPEKDGYTPMHGCCFQGRADVCKVLIAHGINPREKHTDGYEPAFRAVWGKTPHHAETLRVMLTMGKVRRRCFLFVRFVPFRLSFFHALYLTPQHTKTFTHFSQHKTETRAGPARRQGSQW